MMILASPQMSSDLERGSAGSIAVRQKDGVSTENGPPYAETGMTPTFENKFGTFIKRFERSLIKYNLEARGIQRVLPQESQPLTWRSYLQPFLLYFSINLAAQNVTLGMLGPVVYTLSFRDASLCAFFGGLVGSMAVAYIATFGPLSGNRTLIFARYTFGWYPSKLLVVLELIILIGYSLIDLVVAGQVLSAVSVNGSLSVVVGIIILAIITWLISTFGIAIFNAYSRYAFVPAVIAFSIAYGVSSKNFDLSTPSEGNTETVIGNRYGFFHFYLYFESLEMYSTFASIFRLMDVTESPFSPSALLPPSPMAELVPTSSCTMTRRQILSTFPSRCCLVL